MNFIAFVVYREHIYIYKKEEIKAIEKSKVVNTIKIRCRFVFENKTIIKKKTNSMRMHSI